VFSVTKVLINKTVGRISFMNTKEKIKRVILVTLGFGFSTYLIMSGMAILNMEDANSTSKKEMK